MEVLSYLMIDDFAEASVAVSHHRLSEGDGRYLYLEFTQLPIGQANRLDTAQYRTQTYCHAQINLMYGSPNSLQTHRKENYTQVTRRRCATSPEKSKLLGQTAFGREIAKNILPKK